jgi:hypothetical protein
MYLQGQIRRREAVAKVTVVNAIDYFEETGALQKEAGGRMILKSPEIADRILAECGQLRPPPAAP